ncbi:DUF1697 domain-containing protein [Microbacterium oleivorans]|uniref:DUF1697 domain-containing protein n=1 Tax=Microbacterium oleivorans TaxID=273677 RepID=A0A4R5YM17_9MICO|nr:DUF1697 domain-containing protein [Microbacterium oleivorans]TDL45691.1 DUF1697 domain-containing protein [Microbacterium oleivorans]
MTTYLAFLRAINLGAKRVFPKEDIRRVVGGVGFEDVETHINTGNVRFASRMRSRERIERTLEDAFLADRGFEVPSIVYSAAEFREVARQMRELAEANPGLARHYVYLLKDELTPERIAEIEARDDGRGRMVVRGRAAHALLQPGYQDGTVDPLSAAKLLGAATNRNANVIGTLAEKWC